MANNLTGEFDAVVQVSVKTVNSILAHLHRKGGSKDASPSFPHSFAVRVSDTPNIWAIFSEAAKWFKFLNVPAGGSGGAQGSSKKIPPGVVSVGYQDMLERCRRCRSS